MRAKLRAGEIALGAGITLSDPTVTEALASSVDFVWIDMEHNATTVLGPQDLSGSMGRLGETTHPDVIDAMKTVASKAKAAGKFIGAGLGANPEFAQVLIDCGVQWLQAGSDFEYLIQGW